MPHSRVLITGASGLLGGHLCLAAIKTAEVFGAYHAHNTLVAGTHALKWDLSDARNPVAQLEEAQPQIVIHAAVLQVEACEREPELAERVNVVASRGIAEWCRRVRARLVYVSSDLVFEGEKSFYAETDSPKPRMRYGQNKLAAERAVLETCPSACVVRLPLMYGFPAAGGSNFFMSMLARLQRGEIVSVFHDQYRTPGWVNNMAAAVWELARSDFQGLIHVAGLSRCSRLEMAQRVCRLAGFDETLLRSISMFDAAMSAPRPKDVSLDCTLAQKILQTKLLEVEEGLYRALAQRP
jgi:dTDP-4-dehydrorhamnose reductase